MTKKLTNKQKAQKIFRQGVISRQWTTLMTEEKHSKVIIISFEGILENKKNFETWQYLILVEPTEKNLETKEREEIKLAENEFIQSVCFGNKFHIKHIYKGIETVYIYEDIKPLKVKDKNFLKKFKNLI